MKFFSFLFTLQSSVKPRGFCVQFVKYSVYRIVGYCIVLYITVTRLFCFFILQLLFFSLTLSLAFLSHQKYNSYSKKSTVEQLASLSSLAAKIFFLFFSFYFLYIFFHFFRGILCLFVYRLIYSPCVIAVVLLAKVYVSIIGFCAFLCQVSNRTQSKRFHKCTCRYR